MDSYALGQLIQTIFMPFVPPIAGFVLAFLLALSVYLSFRDGFLRGNSL